MSKYGTFNIRVLLYKVNQTSIDVFIIKPLLFKPFLKNIQVVFVLSLSGSMKNIYTMTMIHNLPQFIFHLQTNCNGAYQN